MREPAPPRLRPRGAALAAALAVAVVVPAVAFAGRLGDLLGISNEGTPVSTSRVLPGQSVLDQALQELQVGGTMQYLGTLDGVAFYAGRNADGHFCLAIHHVNEQYDNGVGCEVNADGFPSADRKAAVFPPGIWLEGVAADGVATVEYEDASGNVIDSTPVVNNLFASSTQLPQGEAVYVVSLDANGDVLAKQKLRG